MTGQHEYTNPYRAFLGEYVDPAVFGDNAVNGPEYDLLDDESDMPTDSGITVEIEGEDE